MEKISSSSRESETGTIKNGRKNGSSIPICGFANIRESANGWKERARNKGKQVPLTFRQFQETKFSFTKKRSKKQKV